MKMDRLLNASSIICWPTLPTRLISIIALSVLLSGISNAATTRTDFQAQVTGLSDPAGALQLVTAGDFVTGFFTFDDSPSASFPNDRYTATISITLPQIALTMHSDLNYIRVRNNSSLQPYGTVDYFEHGYDAVGAAPPSFVYYVDDMTVRFVDTTASVFSRPMSLPYQPSLQDFDIATFSLHGRYIRVADAFSINARITSIVVPEPSALVLWCCGIAVLLFHSRLIRG